MKAVVILLLVVASCIAVEYGDSSKELSEFEFRDLSEESSQLCMKSLTACLSRRICYSRAKDISIYCCKSSFTNGKFNYSEEEDCMENEISLDISDCMEYMKSDCIFAIYSYFDKVEDNIKSFEEAIRLKVGEPENEDQCENYNDEMEMEEQKKCEENENKELEWFCDLIETIMEDSPLAKRNCMEDFGKCLLKSIDERKVQDISVSCCKQSISQGGDYYQLNEVCARREYKPYFKDCMEMVPEQCQQTIISRYFEDAKAIQKFNRRVETLVGVPPSELECKDYFKKEMKLMVDMCKENKNEKLVFHCDLVLDIFQDSTGFDEEKYDSFQNEKGINSF